MDLQKLRAETPGTGELVHFNNAGSSLMPEPVFKSYWAFQDEEYREGGYETMVRRESDINAFYRQGAKLLNANEGELAFTDSATTSWQRAFFAIDWKDGDEIITANAEYASNYISFLRLKKKVDINIRVAEDTEDGEVNIDHLESLINARTRLIAITHMPTLSGLVNPAEEIGKIARKHEVMYLLDACQSVGQYPLDVEKIGCDILSGTGRKYLRAPRGTGLLYVSNRILDKLDPMSLDLSSGMWLANNEYKLKKDAGRFETFEVNYAGKVGMAAALKYQNDLNIHDTWARIQDLASNLREQLWDIPGITVHDRGKVRSGIVTFNVSGKSAPEVQNYLLAQRINVSYASVYNSRLYMERYGLSEAVRASVHYYNSEEEIEQVVSALKQI